MAYYVKVFNTEGDFRIRAEYKLAVIEAIKQNLKENPAWGSAEEVKPDWISEFEAWGLYPRTNAEGDINKINSAYSKIRDSLDIFFGIIAPYVNDGSVVGVVGEDGRFWAYEFKNGEVTKHNSPKIKLA